MSDQIYNIQTATSQDKSWMVKEWVMIPGIPGVWKRHRERVGQKHTQWDSRRHTLSKHITSQYVILSSNKSVEILNSIFEFRN